MQTPSSGVESIKIFDTVMRGWWHYYDFQQQWSDDNEDVTAQ